VKIELKFFKNVNVLEVTNGIQKRDIMILRAGLSRLSAQVKKKMIMDLTRAQVDPSSYPAFQDWMIEAFCRFGMNIIVAGSHKQISHVKDVESAIAFLANPAKMEILTEKLLIAQMPWLENRRKELTEKIGRIQKENVTLESLKYENERYASIVGAMEAQVKELLAAGREPFKYEKSEKLEKELLERFKKEGVPLA